MFKKILAVAILSAASVSAVAAENTKADVTLQSAYVYHGRVVSDDLSAGIALRFDDVIAPGLFVTGDFNSIEITPTNDTVTVRSDVGVGFAFGKTLPLEVSFNRVINSTLTDGDYNEARVKANVGKYAYVEVGHGLTENVNSDTYAAVGVQTKLADAITVGGKVSAVRYDTTDEVRYNNAEVFAKYNVWRDLDLTASFSHGGQDSAGREVDNQFWGGVTYRF